MTKAKRIRDAKSLIGETKKVKEKIEINDNTTVSYGPMALSKMFFEYFELDKPLSRLKRDQGANVTEVSMALVSKAMSDRGLSINRMGDIIKDDVERETYSLSNDVDLNDLYRVGKILGGGLDRIVKHMSDILVKKTGLTFEKVFMDWTASYIDGKPNDFVKFGYTKDHREDRPQVTIGLSMDAATGLPIGLTVMTGNTVDVTHFKKTFKQIAPFLKKDSLIIFDNGAYSKENAAMVTEKGLHFLTRAKLNKSDFERIKKGEDKWIMGEDDVCYCEFTGNLGYKRCIYYSSERYNEAIDGYYAKANKDYDEMMELRNSIKKGKVRKKYRNGNMFIDTKLSYLFPLDGRTKEEAVEEAVKRRISGREGFFILTSSSDISALKMLKTYRARNDIESAYRDIKHGIDIRPLRCKDPLSIKGRVLIAFLAYFAISFAKFLVPEIKKKTAETILEEVKSFSVTYLREKGNVINRIYSNFTPIIRQLLDSFPKLSELIHRGERPFVLPLDG